MGRILAALSREGCPVQAREEWLTEFRAVGEAFAPPDPPVDDPEPID